MNEITPYGVSNTKYPISYRMGKLVFRYTDYELNEIRRQMTKTPSCILPSHQNLPPLCIDFNALPADLKNASFSLSVKLGIDPCAVLLGILGGINNALRGRFIVKLNDFWKEPLIDYWLLLAPPGSRKSPLVRELRKPHEDFLLEKTKEYDSSYAMMVSQRKVKMNVYQTATRQVCSKHLAEYTLEEMEQNPELVQRVSDYVADFQANISKDIPVIPARPELFWDSGTMKGLIKQMASQGECAGIMEAEGGFLLDVLSKKDTHHSLFLKAKDMERTSDTISNRRIDVKKPALPLLFVVQPSVYEELYSKKHMADSGGLARFLPYFIPHSYSPVIPRCKDAHLIYPQKITTMLCQNFTQSNDRELWEISVTEEAYDVASDFKGKLDKKIASCKNELLIPFLMKLHGSAVRIAGDIHCWKNPEDPHKTPLSFSEMRLGMNIARALLVHAELAFTPEKLLCAAYARKIANFIVSKGYVDRNDLTSTFFIQYIREITKSNVIPALEMLRECNLVSLVEREKGAYHVIAHPYLQTMTI